MAPLGHFAANVFFHYELNDQTITQFVQQSLSVAICWQISLCPLPAASAELFLIL